MISSITHGMDFTKIKFVYIATKKERKSGKKQQKNHDKYFGLMTPTVRYEIRVAYDIKTFVFMGDRRFYSIVVEDSVLLGCDAVSLG
jgi:hypothetical protein